MGLVMEKKHNTLGFFYCPYTARTPALFFLFVILLQLLLPLDITSSMPFTALYSEYG